jgi:clan AA aspartic protease (TIGR02281 family)
MKQHHFLWALVLPLLAAAGRSSVLAETVPLKADHGTFVVPVVVNGHMTLDFTIDSGASDVVIPSDVLSTLARTGTIAKSDYVGIGEYQLADGKAVRSRRIRLRSVRVGSVEITDVVASETPEAGSLLLGQSFLSRLPSWAIDNQRGVLLINQVPADGVIPSRTQRNKQGRTNQAQPIPSDNLARPSQGHADDSWIYLGDNANISNAEARHGATPDLVWMRYETKVVRGINGAYVETGEIDHVSELIQIDCEQKTQRILLWNGHARSEAPLPPPGDFLHATLYQFVCHRPL